MKQQITLKQWQQLSLGKQRKFQEVSKTGGLPTIGRMIEFLTLKKETTLFITQINCGNELVWSTGSMCCRGNHFHNKDEIEKAHQNDKELCDALWFACVEILNKK